MVNSACSSFSPTPLLTHEGDSFYPFPHPSAFTASDTEARLRALGFGYRASFIHRTAVALCEVHPEDPVGWLEEVIREWDDEDRAREALMGFVGVGRKVADCVLLMSGGEKRKHIVPVDVHVLVRLAVLHSIAEVFTLACRLIRTSLLLTENRPEALQLLWCRQVGRQSQHDARPILFGRVDSAGEVGRVRRLGAGGTSDSPLLCECPS